MGKCANGQMCKIQFGAVKMANVRRSFFNLKGCQLYQDEIKAQGRSLSTTHYQLSIINYPLFTIHYSLSNSHLSTNKKSLHFAAKAHFILSGISGTTSQKFDKFLPPHPAFGGWMICLRRSYWFPSTAGFSTCTIHRRW